MMGMGKLPETRQAWTEILVRHGWNLSSVARALGVPHDTVRRRIARAGLRREYDRNRTNGPRCGR